MVISGLCVTRADADSVERSGVVSAMGSQYDRPSTAPDISSH